MAENIPEKRTWYVCNPLKNRECKKRGCVYNPHAKFKACARTSNPDYALLDKSGKPITVAERDDYRLKLLMDYANKLYAQDMAEARITDEMVEDALATQPHRIPAVETWLKPTDRAGG